MIAPDKKTDHLEPTVSSHVEDYEDMIVEGHVGVIECRNAELRRGLVLPEVDVRALRLKLNLSQSDFAMRYGVPLATLQNWEQKRRRPDTLANLLLHMILDDADCVAKSVSRLRTNAGLHRGVD